MCRALYLYPRMERSGARCFTGVWLSVFLSFHLSVQNLTKKLNISLLLQNYPKIVLWQGHGVSQTHLVFVAKPHSSVGSIADLRTRGRWFDPRLGQYSFWGLMITLATGFIQDSFLPHHCPLFRQAAIGLERIMCRVLVKRITGKHG